MPKSPDIKGMGFGAASQSHKTDNICKTRCSTYLITCLLKTNVCTLHRRKSISKCKYAKLINVCNFYRGRKSNFKISAFFALSILSFTELHNCSRFFRNFFKIREIHPVNINLRKMYIYF